MILTLTWDFVILYLMPHVSPETKEHLSNLPSVMRRKALEYFIPQQTKPITSKQSRFVEEYIIDFNVRRAAAVAGIGEQYASGLVTGRLMPKVYAEITRRIAELEFVSELKAEYVRQYIKDVLELCPTDFFLPAPEGGWLIAQGDYGKLPHSVKRLIESIELRNIRGNTFLAVQFVSKSASLAMAARYTLTQHIDATVTAVPWDQLMQEVKDSSGTTEDAVEERVNQLVHVPGAGG